MARKKTQRYGPPLPAPGPTKQDQPAFGHDYTRSSTYYRAMGAETPRPVRAPEQYSGRAGGVPVPGAALTGGDVAPEAFPRSAVAEMYTEYQAGRLLRAGLPGPWSPPSHRWPAPNPHPTGGQMHPPTNQIKRVPLPQAAPAKSAAKKPAPKKPTGPAPNQRRV